MQTKIMNSAAALAFFLGPLAWIPACPEIAADEQPAVFADNTAGSPGMPDAAAAGPTAAE